MNNPAQQASQLALEAVPLVMRTIRAQLRVHRGADISVPQFRTMGYIDRHEGASLSELASHIGLTPPSMSKLVDGLVERKLVKRSEYDRDRRRICLSLTPLGRDQLRNAHRFTERFLESQLAHMPEEDLQTIARAMELLKTAFQQEGTQVMEAEK